MGTTFLQAVLLVLLACSKFSNSAWYDNFDNVYEATPPADRELNRKVNVKHCPPASYGVERLVFAGLPSNCHKYLKCVVSQGWKNYDGSTGLWRDFAYTHYTTEYWCERCWTADGSADPECPDGVYVFDKENQKCIHPKFIDPKLNKCGTLGLLPDPKCTGPANTEDLHRLGNTTYYIFQNAERTNLVHWEDAKTTCENVGLKLARIDDLQTEVLVGRELEKFIRPLGWIDNWYWMDAKFDRALKTYVWQDTMTAINFSNFYYRPPRPKGYGDFFDNQGNYISEPTIEYCLAISMPKPFPKSYDIEEEQKLGPYGFQTSWWEKECDMFKKGNVLCQTPDKSCQIARAKSIYTEATGNYYEEFWPMSNRRFVVMWTPKSFEEAKELCEEYKMKVYSPKDDDTCLAQNLKNWMKTVTSYSFWTDIKYGVDDRKYTYPSGGAVPVGVRNVTHQFEKRSAGEEIEETCVSITWHYEEFPKNINFCNCSASSVVLSPENCLNRIGVICQHTDDTPRECTTEFYEPAIPHGELVSFADAEKHPKILEYYPFNSNRQWQGGIIRSAYKQQGGAGACQAGFRRVLKDDIYWGTVEDFEQSIYTYDFLAPYWMKMINGKCQLSVVTYDPNQRKLTRTLTDEDCSKWLGFILCKPKPRETAAVGRGMQAKKIPNIYVDLDDGEGLIVSEPH